MLSRLGFCLGFVLMSNFVHAEAVHPIYTSSRPLEIMPASRVAEIQAMLPAIADPWLDDVLSSLDTMWYDKNYIIPGYQDSYGDGSRYPIGFRPNTIDWGLINGAVRGGAQQIFIRKGEFHFPFGRTGGVDDASNTFVVDFWQLPKRNGKVLPVVHWKYQPNGGTRRIEWMFPEGTVFGEVIFITDGSKKDHVFEIRTRRRTLTGWTVDVFRPFPTAESLATALEKKRMSQTSWSDDSSITGLVQFLRNTSTLSSDTLKGSHFKGSFDPAPGAVDNLPAVSDNSILIDLMKQTPFRSAKGEVWKQNGSLKAYAASTKADFSIVPKNYNAALFEVSDSFCNRCHQDAGRPFRDYYDNIQAYGELWGEDDTFSWHPFENKAFVTSDGRVVNFNNDNRKFRQDFVDAGLIEPYQPSKHPGTVYAKIPHDWKGYVYPP